MSFGTRMPRTGGRGPGWEADPSPPQDPNLHRSPLRALLAREEALRWSFLSLFAGSVLTLRPRIAGASDSSSTVLKPLTSVVIVRDSTQLLEDDLTKGQYPDVRAVVEALITNYKLKDSLKDTLRLVDSGAKRSEASLSSQAALEYLYSIIEVREQSSTG